jgi:hypothetical protein
MKKEFLSFTKGVLIVVLGLSILALIAGIIYNLSNQGMKGISELDFKQLGIVIAINLVLIMTIHLISKRIKSN